MGSGKSTIGAHLAQTLSIPFKETDTELIQSSGFSSIAQMISKKGEPYFRNCEYQALKKLLENTNQVISLGGGTICQENIISLFHPDDFIIYLEVPFEECRTRIKEQEKNTPQTMRPLFTDDKAAKELYDQRVPIYKERSHYHIKAESKSPETIANLIISCLTADECG